jgi:hypothetical protein
MVCHQHNVASQWQEYTKARKEKAILSRITSSIDIHLHLRSTFSGDEIIGRYFLEQILNTKEPIQILHNVTPSTVRNWLSSTLDTSSIYRRYTDLG